MADDPMPPPAAPPPAPADPRPRVVAPDAPPPKRMPSRPPLQAIVFVLLGALLGTFGTLSWTDRPTTRTVTGIVAAIDGTASAILLDGPEDLSETGLGVVGVVWRERTGAGEEEWRRTTDGDGNPTCLRPDDVGRPVTLGLVTAPASGDRAAAEVVAWLECGPAVGTPPGDADAGGNDPTGDGDDGGG